MPYAKKKLRADYLKFLFLMLFLCLFTSIRAQPLSAPLAFEDDYKGFVDSVLLRAKVKAHRIYYRPSNSFDKSLYSEAFYNTNGQITAQKWYNFASHKEMYVADYTYSPEGIMASSNEKITEDLDNFDFHSRKLNDELYFVNGTPDNPMGEVIPMNDKRELIVKSYYSKDSLDNNFSTKYFFDGSFYKKQYVTSYSYYGLFMNEDKTVDLNYSRKAFFADTIQEGDTLRISIKLKRDKRECFKLLKKKYQNHFELAELDFVLESLKMYFSMWRGIPSYSITYINMSNFQHPLLLEQHIKDETYNFNDQTIKSKIEILGIKDIHRLEGMNGAYFYTRIKDGYLYDEVKYSVDDGIVKMQETYYEKKHNLPSRIISYSPHFAEIFGPFAISFRRYEQPFIEEIHEYDYFD